MAEYLEGTGEESKAPVVSDAGGAGFHFADTPLKRVGVAEVIPDNINWDKRTFPNKNAFIARTKDQKF